MTDNWKRVSDALAEFLNSETGQELIEPVFAQAHKEGRLTKENEHEFKNQLFLFMFHLLVKEKKEISDLLAMDVYNELRSAI